MRRSTILFVLLVLSWSRLASAQPTTYLVTVDTSSIKGTAGSLDFNFNPGPLTTQAASLQVTGFSSDGSLAGSPTSAGDAKGALPTTLTFDNGKGFNDYFEGFTFGSTLSFSVSLYGSALSSPDGLSTSGSTFAFSMFSNGAGTKPALTTDTTDGFAYIVNVNLDGTTTATSYIKFVPAPMMPTATRLSASPNPSKAGGAVRFVAVVVPGPGSSATPTGVVTFFDGLTQIGSATLSSGAATISVPFSAKGQHPIAAQYGGDKNFYGNLSPVLTQVVE